MKKITLTLAAVAALSTMSYAQEAAEPAVPKEKKVQHQVGVQVNELIRQVFNFSNTNTAITNPYLLTYSLNFAKSGWGIRTGVGYNLSSTKNTDDINEVETTIDQLKFRLGGEKAFTLSKKWSTGVGVDFLYNNDKNKTNSVLTASDTVITKSDTKLQSYGGGAMGWLRYHITDHVLIGTETSFYYTSGTQKQDISITRRDGFNGPKTTKTTTTDNKVTSGKFSVPVAFFLIVKF